MESLTDRPRGRDAGPSLKRPLTFAVLWSTIGWAMVVAVVVLSLIPSVPLPPVEGSDKVAHIIAYFGLMIWFEQLYFRPFHPCIAVVLLALGVLIEFLQRLTPYRSFEQADMIADGMGIALAWGLASTRMGAWLTGIDGWLAGRIIR